MTARASLLRCRHQGAPVWLIFGAFMFALGYERNGLVNRIALLPVTAMSRSGIVNIEDGC